MLYLAILWTRWNGYLPSKLNKYIKSGDKKTLEYPGNRLSIKFINITTGYHTTNTPGHCSKKTEINTFSPTMSQCLMVLGKIVWRSATTTFTTICSISWEIAIILLLTFSFSYIIVGLILSWKLVQEKLDSPIKRMHSTIMLKDFWIQGKHIPVKEMLCWVESIAIHQTSNLVTITLSNGLFLT